MNNNKVLKNASWIIGIQIIKALLGLVISMFTARYLGPSNYGLINYASSIVTFISPLMYLGLSGILVQEIIDNPQREGETLGTSMTMSFVSSLFCILGIFSFTLVANPGEKYTTIICVLYSVLLLFQSIDLIQYWFQAKLLSKYSSIVSLIAFIPVSVYKIFLLVTNKSVIWFAISNVLEYLIISLSLVVIYRKLNGRKLSFSLKTVKRLFSKSRYYIVASMMVSIFSQTDRIMLKIMVDDSATGYYSAGVACAGITSFVFVAIIDSFRPMIFQYKKIDNNRYEKSICSLYSIIIILSLAQSVFITFCSSTIVNILYGSSYEPTINVLRVIVWYTTFSYLGTIRNIWMLAENKEKYIWILNLAGALGNIVLNLMLIPCWGITGAATASLITQVFTNVLMGFIIRPVRYNNELMFKSLAPKYLFSVIKTIKNSTKKT